MGECGPSFVKFMFTSSGEGISRSLTQGLGSGLGSGVVSINIFISTSGSRVLDLFGRNVVRVTRLRNGRGRRCVVSVGREAGGRLGVVGTVRVSRSASLLICSGSLTSCLLLSDNGKDKGAFS